MVKSLEPGYSIVEADLKNARLKNARHTRRARVCSSPAGAADSPGKEASLFHHMKRQRW
jgi:hypothetical protein